MIIKNNTVFFEDTDTPEQIKFFFTEIFSKEKKIEEKEFGNSSINISSLDNLMEQFNKTKFSSLTKSEISQISELLNKEKNSLNNEFKNLFDYKLTSFISLFDYIIRNKDEFKHEFLYDKTHDSYIGDFKGIFKEELNSICSIIGTNPISFYSYEENPKKLKYLDFNKSFITNMKIIQENFISDFNPNDFNKTVKEYLKFKQSLSFEDNKKVTIKP